MFLLFSRLPSRLVRQDHVKEDLIRAGGGVGVSGASGADQRSPIKRTFAEAKQTLPEYDDSPSGYMVDTTYIDQMYSDNSFLEVDEEETSYEPTPYEPTVYERAPYNSKNYSASDSKVRYDEDDKPKVRGSGHTVRSAESFLDGSLPEYCHPEYRDSDEINRYSRRERPPRRRRSRELAENEVLVSSNDDEPKRNPEAMRSVSEDTPTRNFKPVTRRSLSHPEKETQVCDRSNALMFPQYSTTLRIESHSLVVFL